MIALSDLQAAGAVIAALVVAFYAFLWAVLRAAGSEPPSPPTPTEDHR